MDGISAFLVWRPNLGDKRLCIHHNIRIMSFEVEEEKSLTPPLFGGILFRIF
jgi:hypothetical protein